MNKKVYNAVAKRSKGRCEYCGRYGAVELHQKYFDKGYNENKVRRLMGGKLY